MFLTMAETAIIAVCSAVGALITSAAGAYRLHVRNRRQGSANSSVRAPEDILRAALEHPVLTRLQRMQIIRTDAEPSKPVRSTLAAAVVGHFCRLFHDRISRALNELSVQDTTSPHAVQQAMLRVTTIVRNDMKRWAEDNSVPEAFFSRLQSSTVAYYDFALRSFDAICSNNRNDNEYHELLACLDTCQAFVEVYSNETRRLTLTMNGELSGQMFKGKSLE